MLHLDLPCASLARTTVEHQQSLCWPGSGGGEMKVKGFSRMFCFAVNMVESHLKDLSQRFQMHCNVKSLVECADDISEHGPANNDTAFNDPKNCSTNVL